MGVGFAECVLHHFRRSATGEDEAQVARAFGQRGHRLAFLRGDDDVFDPGGFVISVAIAENCSVSLPFLLSMRVWPADFSAVTNLETSESMSSPEPMPVELIVAMNQRLSGCHVKKRARPLIQMAPHLKRFFIRDLPDDCAGSRFTHGDDHVVSIGVDAKFQVPAIRT